MSREGAGDGGRSSSGSGYSPDRSVRRRAREAFVGQAGDGTEVLEESAGSGPTRAPAKCSPSTAKSGWDIDPSCGSTYRRQPLHPRAARLPVGRRSSVEPRVNRDLCQLPPPDRVSLLEINEFVVKNADYPAWDTWEAISARPTFAPVMRYPRFGTHSTASITPLTSALARRLLQAFAIGARPGPVRAATPTTCHKGASRVST